MNQDVFVVTAASGQIGSHLTGRLLDAGKKVRVVSRSEANLKQLTDRGAEAFPGSVGDAAFLTRAFRGAQAVFTLIPPFFAGDYRRFQEKVSLAFASAIEKAGVSHVVDLSSVGAHIDGKTGPILGLHHNEKRLDALSGVHVLHLRPAFFMENHLMGAALVRDQGIYGTPLRPDLALPQIATADIADVAAEAMLGLDFQGKTVRELLGPREYTLEETAKILGSAAGKPDLPYVQFPYEGAHKAMTEMGLAPEAVDLMIEMYRGFNDGSIRATQARSASTTTPTSLEDWAKSTFAPAVHG